MRRCSVLLPALLAGAAAPAGAGEWRQLQNGPQRLGYSDERLDVPVKNAWAVGLSPERLHPQAQPVIADGKVFIGTEMGRFHAFDARDGKPAWGFEAGGPILHTAGAEGGRVFFGCMDGCVYALNTADGSLAWKFDSRQRTGFSTAVLLADGNVFLASRGGTYFALSQRDGSILWTHDVGAPVLMSSAYDWGRLFFGAMDMRVHALDAATGNQAWASDPLPGAAFKDYWPVVTQGYVLVRPLKVSGGSGGGAIEWIKGPLPQPELDKQAAMTAQLAQNPSARNLIVLDAQTGTEPFVVPQWVTNTMNGATAPPCADGDGMLIVPATLHDWRGGWGRLDLVKRLVTEVLHDGKLNEKGYAAGTGNSDENLLLSAAGRLVFTFHTEEMNAHYTGIWHLDRQEWTRVPPYHVDQMFSSNTQGGGGNPVAVANGMLYHTSWNTLNARTATVLP